MIEYEKLKLAHDLANTYYNDTGESVLIEFNIALGCATENYTLWIDKAISIIGSIDSIILKLQELTLPKPKFKIGQKVRYKHPLIDQYVEDEILAITRKPCGENQYGFSHYAMMESDVLEKDDASENNEPKFKIGQEIWFFDWGKIKSLVIDTIDYEHGGGFYYIDKDKHYISDENIIYPSREALIDAQIEYWMLLKNESMIPKVEKVCKHESDGVVWRKGWTEPPDKYYECKKCGQFLEK